MSEDKIKYRITIDPDYAEEGQDLGISRIAYTKTPAIMVKGMAFKSQAKVISFADDLKYRIAAPALIPMEIYRRDEAGEYYVEFTKEEIEDIYVKLMSNKPDQLFNLEHNDDDKVGAFLLESWLVGKDTKADRSFSEFGIDVPEGTLMIVSQFTDKERYKEIVENDQVGYSIEGFLGLKLSKQEFEESYTDYPKQASENAKIALRWAEENGWGECGTDVGKARANQLANNEPISRDTIARMAAFERHRQNSDKELGDGCGRLMWLAWGGDEGVEWAQRKLEQIDKNKQKMENLMLPDGEHTIGEKIYVIKDGAVVEIKDVVKEEMSVEEEAVIKDAAEDIADDTKKEEMAEDVKEDEEAPVVEDAAEDIADEVKKEEMAIDPVADEAAILAVIQPKLDEIYQMIAEIKAAMESDIEEEIVEEVQMSKQEAFKHNFIAITNFLSK